MRAVVQRVSKAKVTVSGRITGEIDKGLLVLVGIGRDDDGSDVEWLVDKTLNLRVFEDENEKMNLSLIDVSGALLAISQFTIMGDARKGRRPSFTEAAEPEAARALFNDFLQMASKTVKVETGIFQAHMDVELVNSGPVTILLDSKRVF
ncbi:D-tyrosyl-tRNA(Tyr) deacylase [Mesotoga sp. Brook.08.YT.4.2.5.1]|uniref:D-aminoacyl-tRNA deacylase n=1 Tax=Mesotoga prima TaxID=1184387 RepID=A0A101HP41_9BACT|nr:MULTISPECIES: D-aminoacyl-tRNA deacylase [unclassified Mesotoga]KUK80233.1 MAG: D-tyrosyl-tRNA(Tyr) deacylase [Mesotoga prima]MDD3460037.1 D-aminoacyl-tRNA deacylase [Mesotoga sp.]PNQ05165.1 D-tyrosyl-tRNA(Tyr) deacylase [Mesotoga sp. SC_NapDC3]PXF34213.1 D-tyrosyl-tRNA(Tyr) deacylase [Mesotoga sp. SC_NapDC]RIZ61109.1 D-tyrosyl-tRNA(Tyr) deacylase [Mesotoga sp. SC_NapDC2]